MINRKNYNLLQTIFYLLQAFACSSKIELKKKEKNEWIVSAYSADIQSFISQEQLQSIEIYHLSVYKLECSVCE